jgi:hypothetical protein
MPGMEDTCPAHRTAVGFGRCHRCAALGLWSSAPAATRAQVDALLRRRAVVPAVAALRAALPAGAPSAVHPVLDAVLERRRWLADRGEVSPPPPEPTVDEMVATIVAADAPPVAVEVCWDGDASGWIADLVAVVARPGDDHPHYDEVALWSYRGADVADRGRAVARLLGVPFHFDHSGAPDIGLPRWWDRHWSPAPHNP